MLGAIYLKDRDSSQGKKNLVVVQSTQPEEKTSIREAMHLGSFVRVAKFCNPCEIS